MARGAWRVTAAVFVATGSGFAGLGYQIVWTQQGSLWLGHEAAAVLAVVAAFFGGIALGAMTLGRAVRNSPAPLRWFVACECVIAVWALLLAVTMEPATNLLLHLVGPEPSRIRHWSTAFGGTLLLLLPATAAMGLTLPALERLVPRSAGASFFGGLYAGNTLGAVLGVLASAFWLVPTHGLRATAVASASINLLCAILALWLFRAVRPENPVAQARGRSSARSRLLLNLAITGVLGIGYEVVALRVLYQVTEATVYTFACALAVYLAGTTIGAAIYQKTLAGRARWCARVLPLFAAVATLCGAAGLWSAQMWSKVASAALGSGLSAAMGTEAVLAFAAFVLPTLAMGALFTHLCTAACESGASFGEATGWNGIGAALAPALFGVIAVPVLGPKWSLLLLSAGYLTVLAQGDLLRGWTLLAVVPAGALALFAPALAFVEVPAGGKIVSYKEGATAAVSVVEDGEGVLRLRIDNREQEGSSASYWFDARQAWLPLLLHPSPKHALFLGMGTGVTAAAATEDPELQVDVVELLPEVIASSHRFTTAFDNSQSARVIAADARRYVKASDRRYDVVVSDNFHPARGGSGSLYTVEHFQAVKQRLAAGGLFCQWLPLHQLDLYSLRSILRAYLAAFPNAIAVLASNSLDTPVIGLLGGADDRRIDSQAVTARRMRTADVRNLPELGFEDDYAELGSVVAGPQALRRFAGDAAVNTDDHPVVAYRAPLLAYAPDSLPRDRLLQLLSQWTIAADEVLEDSASPDLVRRLAAYWQARNLYIEVGSKVRPVGGLREMLGQVQQPLLSVLGVSPDFTPAFNPLLQMATALADQDPRTARDLAAELVRIRPDHPGAHQLLEKLTR